MTVYGGTQKITIGANGADTDFVAKRNAALAQAAFLDMGVKSVEGAGSGSTFMMPERSPQYGNINDTTGDVIQGAASNFSQPGDTFGMPLENVERQTGSLSVGTSSTNDPQTQPDQLDESALQARIRRMGENGSINLNPSSVYGLS